jgi:hypothetical protein
MGKGKRCLVALSVVAAAFTVGSVGQASAAPVPPPASMAAIGDSFTYGFATGAPGCATFVTCPAYSWSTGTSVNSHYQRLVALNPALTGQAANAAVLGAPMSSFVSQASAVAPSQPDYVTVLLGGGDVCFGATTTAQFTASFRAGMDVFAATSPSSRVLVASIWDFESMRTAVLAGNPSATFPFCQSFFNAAPATRASMMARVVDFNAALAAECATYANCRFDGNALFNHVWATNELSPVDNFHPSVAGQEMIASVLFGAGYEWGTPGVESVEDCKRGGWATVTDDHGRPFRNQGDCVSYVRTSGRNGARG